MAQDYGLGHGGEYQVDSLDLPLTTPAFSAENTTSVVGIKQTMTATNNFGGLLPTTTPAMTGKLYIFPTDTQGGLFDPGNESQVVRLVAVELDLANQTSWKLEFVDADSNAYTLYSGTTEASYFVTDPEILYLLPGETLKLTTVGATAAMSATLKFKNDRTW
jgi:hypothetical protein